MDELSNAEVFGDIPTVGFPQNLEEEIQSLFRMNTNELLQLPTGGSQDLYGIASMQSVKYEEDEKPFQSTMMMGGGSGGELLPNHFKKIPQLDEFSHPSLNFNVAIGDKSCSASSWCYAKEQDKLFVKKKTPVTFDVSYTQLSDCNLKLRIMLVYSNSQFAYNIISRCQDDIVKDGAKGFIFKEHVVRCLNPDATFTGREDGVNFEDRLAVLVGLNNGVGTQNQQTQQTVPVSLEFLCQNSCPTMERRATTLLFTLENEHGTLLGRKSISVKICSCPRRDMVKDGRKTTDGRQSRSYNKRKNANEEVSSSDQPPRKLTRQSSVDLKPSSSNNIKPSTSSAVAGSSMLGQLKREPSFTPLGYSLSNMSTSSNNAIDNDSSAIVLTMRLPDLECASEVARYAFKHLSSILISCKDEREKKRYAQYLTHCRRVRKHFERSAQTQEEPDLDYDSS